MKTYQNFDDIYTLFMDISKIDEFELPKTPDGMYALFENGLNQYLLIYDDAEEVEFDRETEQLSVPLTINDATLIARCMRSICLQKIYDKFVSTYDVLQAEIGVRNYKSQADARYALIENEEKKIQSMLLKMSEDFDLLDG